LLPRLHFGIGLFVDSGSEAKVTRFSKYITMLGISILVVSSKRFEADEFESGDVGKAIVQVILGLLVL